MQALLKQPGAVTKLMDLLGDSQDVIRNEALLLMIGLTHSSPDIKRFAAYEGAFENQISIIRQEASLSLLNGALSSMQLRHDLWEIMQFFASARVRSVHIAHSYNNDCDL